MIMSVNIDFCVNAAVDSNLFLYDKSTDISKLWKLAGKCSKSTVTARMHNICSKLVQK